MTENPFVTIRLDRDTYNRIREMAKAENRSIPKEIKQLVQEARGTQR